MKSLTGVLMVASLLVGGLASAPAQSSEDSSNYRLTANDLLDFRVFQEPELDAVIRLSGDGTASFPLVGNVTIGGKTVSEAVDILKARYRDGYLVSPQVSLTVRTYAKQRFTVLGQVQKPGAYEMQGTEAVSLLQAIGLAGGYTRIADPSNITVKRRESDGKERVIRFNAKRMAKGGDDASFMLKAGDVVSVGESLF
ncbi:polysaccharide biosynthesis protein [Spartobacteria bacterium LR76]|nr:polysaccharide biosynthesis protein [Spartobacteria bacterium LR76]